MFGYSFDGSQCLWWICEGEWRKQSVGFNMVHWLKVLLLGSTYYQDIQQVTITLTVYEFDWLTVLYRYKEDSFELPLYVELSIV